MSFQATDLAVYVKYSSSSSSSKYSVSQDLLEITNAKQKCLKQAKFSIYLEISMDNTHLVAVIYTLKDLLHTVTVTQTATHTTQNK